MAIPFNKLGFETRAIHAGQTADKVTGAVMTPIFQNSTYQQKAPGEPISHYEYSRTDNPTRHALEENLASLENGKYGIAFSSGCAALSNVLQTLKQGDHCIVSDDVYGGTYRLFNTVFKDFGIHFTQVNLNDETALLAAKTPSTKLIWAETPTNPLLKITDLKKLSAFAKQHKIILAVDNTFATPYFQNPLDLGADVVCHSTTKYLSGHSDVVGGALMLNDSALFEKLKFLQNAVGAVPGPFDCFLLLRSTKTLALRMQKHEMNAKAIAQFLSTHSAVSRVIYPGLTSHPDYAIAKTQMRGFGGMVSFELKGSLDHVKHFFAKLRLFTLAESLGGVESLTEHPALMTHASLPAAQRAALGITDQLIRLSVGIESEQDLVADLTNALS